MTEYYKYLIATSTRNKDTSGGTVGFIPFKLTITMDGLSGIKIYNVLHINTEFLPIAYGRTVDLIVTGVSHKLSNNDWETSIETTAMPKTSSPFGNVSKTTSTRPTKTNSTIITENNVKKGSTTYGVVGFNTPNPILFPKALSKDTILNQMKDIFGKTFDETTPLNIRERIVMIALSYVGQIEKIDNRGYTDQNFQQRIHKSGWYDKAAWCGFFQKLVWQEAYTTGNLVVPAAPPNLQILWKNKAKTIPSPIPGDEKKNSEKYKLWIPISGTPKPGDLVVMNSGHGEIFLKSIKNKNKITYYTIGGNSSNKVSYNTYIRPSLVKGFASVVTS